jgi:hypothetical protein
MLRISKCILITVLITHSLCNAQPRESINVKAGWNLIGLYNNTVAINQVITSPTGILTGSFYRFILNSGYQIATSLEPGYAYWIQSTANGTIILP